MDEALKKIWAAYDRKLERTLALNMQLVKAIQLQKVQSVLRPLYNIKLVGVIFGCIWLAFVGFLIRYSLSWEKIFFVISAGIHWIVSAVAVGVYIYHMSLLREVNNSDNVVETQRKLARLEASSLQIGRILLVQLPVFVSFQMTPVMFTPQERITGIIYVIIVLLFTWAGIWCYRHLNYQNVDKPWFRRFILRGREMAPIRKALVTLREIDEFEQ